MDMLKEWSSAKHSRYPIGPCILRSTTVISKINNTHALTAYTLFVSGSGNLVSDKMLISNLE